MSLAVLGFFKKKIRRKKTQCNYTYCILILVIDFHWLVCIKLTRFYFYRGCRCRDPMIYGFTTTLQSVRILLTLWVWIPLRRGVLDTTLCDKVCQWLVAGWWFSPGTPISSTNKTDRHDVTEILLKVALNIITPTHNPFSLYTQQSG